MARPTGATTATSQRTPAIAWGERNQDRLTGDGDQSDDGDHQVSDVTRSALLNRP
jgi:hypothetical protein